MSAEETTRLRLAEARFKAVGIIGGKIAAGAPLDEILHTIAAWSRALQGRFPPFLATDEAERAKVGLRPAGAWLLTANERELQLRGGIDFPPEQTNMRIGADYGLPGLATQTGEPLLVTNTDHDPRFVQILATGRVGSTLQIPLKIGGKCVGIVFVAAMNKDTFWPSDFEDMKVWAALAEAAIKSAGRFN